MQNQASAVLDYTGNLTHQCQYLSIYQDLCAEIGLLHLTFTKMRQSGFKTAVAPLHPQYLFNWQRVYALNNCLIIFFCFNQQHNTKFLLNVRNRGMFMHSYYCLVCFVKCVVLSPERSMFTFTMHQPMA